MLKKFRKNQKGFTLIELLIVVAIIGILAAIAIPQFAAYRQKAYNSAAQSDLKNHKTGLEAYMADNQDYPAALEDSAGNAIASGSPSNPGVEVVSDDTHAQTISNLSTNVSLGATYNTATYAINTYHSSGTKVYGTAYDGTSLYFKEIGVGGTHDAPDADSITTFPTESYTEM